jgi:hypothetical protein
VWRHVALHRKGEDHGSIGQVLLEMDKLIWCSSAIVLHRTRRDWSLEGVIKVIDLTWHILYPDVMRFGHDPLVAIHIFWLAIMSPMHN